MIAVASGAYARRPRFGADVFEMEMKTLVIGSSVAHLSAQESAA
jgi:hypothetical protein